MDNRGLTLVELLVAIVISMVVIGAIWQFMLISTKSYDSQKTITDLQQEVQQTLNHVENLVIDADRAVDYRVEGTKKILEIFSSNKIGKLTWDQDKKTLEYTETAVAEGIVSETSESAILAEGVESFETDISKVESNKIIKISLGFAKKGKTYEATRNITLRNLVVSSGVISEIYKGDVAPEVATTIVFNDPEDEVDPGKSYGFQATVTGADDTKLIWTVLGNTSENTYMDVATGRLTVGMDESVGEITVVATLASDREIFAMHTVTVKEAPPVSITIEHFPSTVVYGGEYLIEATTNPTGYDVTWQVVSGNASIVQTVTNEDKLKVSMTQDGSQTIQVIAKVNIDSEREVTSEVLTATVRKPEFMVKATSNGVVNPTGYDRGSQVTLAADWTQSYANNNNYVESDESFYNYKYVNYTNGAFTNETIEWEYYLGNSTQANKVEGNTITLPTDMSVSQVKVVGKSVKYPFITAQQVLNLKDPTVTITSSFDGDIPFNQDVTLTASVTGMDTSTAMFAEWSAKTNDNQNVALTVSGNGRTATFKLTDTNKYKGKMITVTVKEVKTNKIGTITLNVVDFIECNVKNTDTPDATLKYIFAERSGNSGEYPKQNSFFIPMDNMKKLNFKYTFYNKRNGTVSNFQDVMKFTIKDNGILCNPTEESKSLNYDYGSFSHIILHFDNKDTGEHVALYKVIPVTTSYKYSKLYYVLPCYPENLSNLYVNKKYTEPSGTEEYVNFYGKEIKDSVWDGSSSNYPEAKAYDYEYTYEYKKVGNSILGSSKRDCYEIEVEHEGGGGFTLNYYKNSNTWRQY